MILLLAFAGALFLDGGSNAPEIGAAFGRLANGPILLVPTALPDSALNEVNLRAMPTTGEKYFGVASVKVLHAATRAEAGSEDFLRPLREYNAVFFLGGDHNRLIERYAGTRFEAELKALHRRGGVVGGSSAGAMVLGSYQAARPGRKGSAIVDSPTNVAGFALLPDTLIDVHFSQRRRQRDIPPILRKHPELQAIGIDERTALIVQDGGMHVAGSGTVTIYKGRAVRVLK